MSAREMRERLRRIEGRLPPSVVRWLHGSGRHLFAPNRRAVARGVALGVFLGFVVPLGQFPAAIVLASVCRANVVAALAGTLVTNPLTVAAVYAAAFWVGRRVLEWLPSRALGDVVSELPAGAPAPGWLGSLAVGLMIFATLSAAAAFVAVDVWWRLSARRRWLRRPAARTARNDTAQR